MRATLALAFLLTAASFAGAQGCGNWNVKPPTIREEVRVARAVLYVTLTATRPKKDDPEAGETEFGIEAILRDHAALKDKKKLVVKRAIPLDDKKNPPKYLILCAIDKGAIDPYRGIILHGPRSAEYVKKAIALDPKDAPAALAFFFRHLEDADPEVAKDAFQEFTNADDAHVVKAAPKFDAVRLRAWLMDPKTPKYRRGLLALLLGTCGKKADVDLVRALLPTADRVDFLLAAHVLLAPREGFAHLRAAVREQKSAFMHRYHALLAVRFLYETRKGLVPEKDLVGAVCQFIQQDDIADLAIEDLRRWGRWEAAPLVMAETRRPSFAGNKLMNRVVLRYCLQCKGNAEASNHVAFLLGKDAGMVKEAEELLALETAPRR